MSMSTVLIAIALISALWGVVSTLVIADALQKRGVKVNWILLRMLILKYIGQYRDVTRKETGRAGPWSSSYIIAMNLALVTMVAGLILRA
ncbi:hypothetical protein KAJ02_09310 [Candidatus Bipolaricaulota bacterium]|nr:hypothetical protein [Candidatus Bipolaricaulota bacterium]